MTTTYEQKRVLHDEAPLMLGAWQFAPEMKQVRGGRRYCRHDLRPSQPARGAHLSRRRLDDILYGLLAQKSPFLPPSGWLVAAA